MTTDSRGRIAARLMAAATLVWLASAGAMAEAQSQVPVRGFVRTASGAPVARAVVSTADGRITVETGADGWFQIALTAGPQIIRITRRGYADFTQQIDVGAAPLELTLVLTALARFSEDVTVSAVRAPVEAPISKRDIPRGEIEARNFGQEMPFLLSQVPSVTQYADSGAPSGYSYIYLRGIPQTRMNVTIDGMPINEPEDSAFYFSNFGDLADAVDSIQVQRGVGTSSVGAASFVGSINFASAAFTDRPGVVVRLGAGSFGSARLNATVNSGNLGRGFRVYAQAAAQESDGFRDHSGVSQKSLYAGVLREVGSSYLKVFGFFGRAQSSLAYLAADEASLAVDLRTNPLTPEERDQFGQQFVTAQYHRALSPNADISAQGFYNGADGWYRIRNTSAEPSGLYQYGLAWHNAGASVGVHAASAHADFTWGAFYSDFESLHTRGIVSGAADYSNRGFKNEFNTFAKLAWSSGRWRWFGDVQLRWARFRYEGTVPLGSVDWTFFNPKAGARYDAGHGFSLFASIGRGNREPARSDMLQGEDNATVRYNLSAVLPEQVVDTEFGASYARPGFNAEVNGYLMAFRHEIAQTGGLSEIGLPLRRNVDRSYRRGIEVDLAWRPVGPLQVRHTSTFSLNRIETWTQFYDVYDAEGGWAGSTSLDHDDVPPYVTPAILAMVAADYTPTRGATVGATWRYVGKWHLDNTGSRDFVAPSFTCLDLAASVDLARVLTFAAAAHPMLRAQVTNVLDNRRMFPNGYSYQYFAPAPTAEGLALQGTRYYYPLATRSAFVGLELRF
jgi:iron complex outermembrane receptor protein